MTMRTLSHRLWNRWIINAVSLLIVLSSGTASVFAQPQRAPAVLAFPAHAEFTSQLTVVGQQLFFATYDSVSQQSSLWQSDGTDAGTFLVRGGFSGFLGWLSPLGGVLLFAAAEPGSGYELWKSDGTAQGTLLVKDMNPGPNGSQLSSPVRFGSKLVSNADDSIHGSEPWVTDGTPAGTMLLVDTLPGPASGNGFGSEYAVSGGRLFFTAGDNQQPSYTFAYNSFQLWQSDGTPPGTSVIKDRVRPPMSAMRPAPQFGQPGPPSPATPTISALTPWQTGILFTVNASEGQYELWRSDGSAAGTQLVRSSVSIFNQDHSAQNIQQLLIFRAQTSLTAPLQLWRSDGTTSGTIPLLADSALSQSLFVPFPGDTSIIVSATGLDQTGRWKSQLWRSDSMISQLNPLTQVGDWRIRDLRAQGTSVFLVVSDSRGTYPSKSALWQSDGTSSGARPGTRVIMDFPGDAQFIDQSFTDQLLFQVSSTDTQRTTLWASDGTSGGTRSVLDLGVSYTSYSFAVPFRGGLVWLINDGSAYSLRMLPGPAVPFVQIPTLAGAPAGGLVSIPIQYGTNGATANGIQLSLILSAGLTYIDDSSGVTPTQQGNTLTWALPDLPLLGTRRLYVRVAIPSGTLGTRFPISSHIATNTQAADLSHANVSGELMRAAQVFFPVVALEP